MSAVDVELYEVTTPEEIERVRLMMERREVWRNLAYADQPGKGTFYLQFHNGRYAGHLIRERATGREIGFVVLMLGRLKSLGTIEVDIAIPDPADRGRGRSKTALALVFDAWMLTDRCSRCYGWIEATNEASVRMVKALNLDVSDRVPEGGHMADGRVDTVEVQVNKQQWLTLRERFGLPAFQPPVDGVYPPPGV